MLKRRGFLAGLGAAAFALVLSLKPPEPKGPEWLCFDYLADFDLEAVWKSGGSFLLWNNDGKRLLIPLGPTP